MTASKRNYIEQSIFRVNSPYLEWIHFVIFLTNDICVSLKKCHWINCFNHGVGIIMSFCSNELDWLCIHDDLTTLCAPKFRFDLMTWKKNVYDYEISILQKWHAILVGQYKSRYCITYMGIFEIKCMGKNKYAHCDNFQNSLSEIKCMCKNKYAHLKKNTRVQSFM